MVQYRQFLGLAVLCAGIGASFVHHFLYFSTSSSSFFEIWASFFPPVLVLVTSIAVIGYVYRSEISTESIGRVSIWYVACGVVFGLAGYASLQNTFSASQPFSILRLSVANWAIGGSFIGLLLGFYDARQSNAVTLARTREREATRQAQRLSVLNRVLRHDIRNKLTIIKGHLDLLGDHESNASLGPIERAADDLLEISNRVRNLHAVTQEESPQPVDLSEYVRNALTELREEHPKVTVHAEMSDDTLALTYPVIEATIRDLLQNAIVHHDHEDSDIVIDVQLHETRGPDGEYAQFVIEDNGPGIPANERVILKEGRETQLGHSLGTGLWLTRWIVEESNGSFDFSTSSDRGTRVEFRLPVAG